MFLVISGRFKAAADPGAARYQGDLNEHLGQRTIQVRMAGALRDADGKETGFMIILEAEGFDAARAYLESGPFFRAGLYDRVEIARYAIEVGAGQLS